MMRFTYIVIFIALCCIEVPAQFKKQAEAPANINDGFIRPAADGWYSLFNPNNFEMRHSYSMNYITSGGSSLALQQYTNTMMYSFAPNLVARVDLSLQNSPYSSFDYRLQNQMNRAYISRAEINYKPWENTFIRLSYQEFPNGFYNPFYSPFQNWYSGVKRYEDE